MNDYQILAAVLLGLDLDEVADDGWDDVEEQFADKYNFGLGEVEDLIEDLLKLTIPFPRPVIRGTKQPFDRYHIFARQCPNNPTVWEAILRREYQPPQK